MKIGVVGLGYVGLPLAVEFGKYYETLGFDISKRRIEELIIGVDVTNECCKSEIINSKKLRFSNVKADLCDIDIFIVTVPTPITRHKQPDTDPLKSACEIIGSVMKKNSIIVFESTVYPGMTEEFCVPLLEVNSGLIYEKDFFCGYSPERINPGDKQNSLTTITKIVSATDINTLKILERLYSRIISAGVYLAPSIKVAEAAKVIENIQRDVNIALVNELSQIFNKLNIDTFDVLNAASTKWNFVPFRPGLVGGHCIGVDPYYLTHKAQEVGHYPQIILSGRSVNEGMSKFATDLLVKEMIANHITFVNQSVLILGITFKENCPDIRNSKVFDLIENLNSYNFNVDVYDPYFKSIEIKPSNFSFLTSLPKTKRYGAIILAVPHEKIVKLGSKKIKAMGKAKSIFFDLKGYFNIDESDLRL